MAASLLPAPGPLAPSPLPPFEIFAAPSSDFFPRVLLPTSLFLEVTLFFFATVALGLGGVFFLGVAVARALALGVDFGLGAAVGLGSAISLFTGVGTSTASGSGVGESSGESAAESASVASPAPLSQVICCAFSALDSPAQRQR